MSTFWPDGLELTDTQSPREILSVAKENWQQNSSGVMDLVLQDAASETGNSIIVVHAKHIPSNRTATLLSVVHRDGQPYPVTIEPKDEDLPSFLRKSYYEPNRLSLFEINKQITGLTGETVSNPWVSDTPMEFRKKLADAFNLGVVKGKLLNLASIAREATAQGDIESSES